MVVEVNLEKIGRNARKIKEELGKVKLCAVVKADGYGHGAEKVAETLIGIADYFAVATVDEGVKLRLSGIDKPILCLCPPDVRDVETMLDYRLGITVDSLERLRTILSISKEKNIEPSLHLKIDTGMHRFGLSSVSEAVEAVSMVKACGYLLESVYSHFCNIESDVVSRVQFERFMEIARIVKSCFKRVIRHISASGGFLKEKKYRLDMVRCGILLYGYKPFESDYSVEKAMKLYARNIRTGKAQAGECLGYGDYRLPYDTDYSVLGGGYADGIARSGAIQTLNACCMDVMFVEGRKHEEYVDLKFDADVIAKNTGTINYEVLVKTAMRRNIKYIRG